jgi:hypothetical protein
MEPIMTVQVHSHQAQAMPATPFSHMENLPKMDFSPVLVLHDDNSQTLPPSTIQNK